MQCGLFKFNLQNGTDHRFDSHQMWQNFETTQPYNVLAYPSVLDETPRPFLKSSPLLKFHMLPWNIWPNRIIIIFRLISLGTSIFCRGSSLEERTVAMSGDSVSQPSASLPWPTHPFCCTTMTSFCRPTCSSRALTSTRSWSLPSPMHN